jgi:hypothetical protein
MTDDTIIEPDAIVGHRAWRIVEKGDQVRLMSLTNRKLWPPRRALQAECRRKHDPPEVDCRCGIYAASSPELLAEMHYPHHDGKVALGEVSLWGTVIEAERGYRATLAYPRRLLIPHSLWTYALTLRDTYGVPTGLVNPFVYGSPPAEEEDGWK